MTKDINSEASDLFESVAQDLVARDPTLERGRMLHSPGLRTAGRFFAFATPADLVVKLPASRVRELIATCEGRPCEIRRGAPMREWVRLAPGDRAACTRYVEEARDFIVSQQRN